MKPTKQDTTKDTTKYTGKTEQKPSQFTKPQTTNQPGKQVQGTPSQDKYKKDQKPSW